MFVPPLPGTEVRRAIGAERDEALDFDRRRAQAAGRAVPRRRAGVLDLDFLDGTKGAHVNICGISGVATKTSYATFLLYSLFNSGVLGAEAANTKAPDLQRQGRGPAVPRPRQHRARRRASATATRQLGLPAGAVPQRRRAAPRPGAGDPNGTPDVGARTTGVRPFFWTIADFCATGLLPFLFADAEDDRQQYTIVVHNVDRRAATRRAATGDTSDGAVTHRRHDRARRSDDLVARHRVEADARPTRRRRSARGPAGPIGRGTVNAFVRRLHGADAPRRAPRPRRRRRRPDQHSRRPRRQQVTVVDLHNLNDRAKRFVVGVVLRQAFDAKEAPGTAAPAAVRRARRAQQVRAPRRLEPDQGDPPRRRRARPLASASSSSAPSRRPARSSAASSPTRPSGSSAASTPPRPGASEYGFLPAVQRQRATILKPGTMFVSPARAAGAAAARVPVPGVGDPQRRGGGDTVTPTGDPFDGLT